MSTIKLFSSKIKLKASQKEKYRKEAFGGRGTDWQPGGGNYVCRWTDVTRLYNRPKAITTAGERRSETQKVIVKVL